ncbi:MAG: hypothetical protein Kapaf2KO_20150 [Candidatus Kapaibacteriales bacterium]
MNILTVTKYDYLIDSHSHIDGEQFESDLDQVIERAKDQNVRKVIIPAIEPSGYDRLLEICDKHEALEFGIGVHPHSSGKVSTKDYDRIEQTAYSRGPVAIGEIGLEYFYDFVPVLKQKEVFAWHLSLARQSGLPALMHTRDAEHDVLDMYEKEKGKPGGDKLNGVMHCFSSDIEVFERAMELGLTVSFTGNVTFKKFDRTASVEAVPMDKFMLETDAPYMAPVPNRGKRNEPSFLPNVAQMVADIKQIDVSDVIHSTTENALRFFRLTAIAILTLMFSVTIYGDDRYDGYEDDDEEEYDPEATYNRKSLGFGGNFGTNTIINSIDRTNEDGNIEEIPRSYDGLFGIGGGLYYNLSKNIVFEAFYNRSVDNSVVEEFGLDPYVYQLIMGHVHYIFNPTNAIQFSVSAGAGIDFTEESYKESDGVTNFTVQGSSFTAGGSFNIGYDIDLGSSGVLNVNAGWYLLYPLGEFEGLFLFPGETQPINSTFTRSYSLPRFALVYYPNLW